MKEDRLDFAYCLSVGMWTEGHNTSESGLGHMGTMEYFNHFTYHVIIILKTFKHMKAKVSVNLDYIWQQWGNSLTLDDSQFASSDVNAIKQITKGNEL